MSKAYVLQYRNPKKKDWRDWVAFSFCPNLEYAQRELVNTFRIHKEQARRQLQRKWDTLMQGAKDLPTGKVLEYGSRQWRIMME